MSLAVTFSRTALGLPDLVVPDNPYAGRFHVAEVGHPQFSLRKRYAEESYGSPGRVLLAAVADTGTLPLTLYAHGDTWAEVVAATDELDAATSQWSYTLTLTQDGVTRSYTAEPELATWTYDEGMVKARLASATIIIALKAGSL